MIKKNKIPAFLALLLAFGMCMNAQEQLRPLHANNSLISLPVKNGDHSRTAIITTLDTIPFFEDFSYSATSPYPSLNHWIDSNVFVNHTFPVAPPSMGVATFDGLNKKGYPYNLSAQATSSAPADKLTSRPINLQKKGAFVYAPADSIYLSFYYQAGGRGYNPSPADSLSLDFYKPNQKKWQRVWSSKGYNPTAADSLFHLVMLPIKDTAYFDSLFQFRFSNRATLTGSLDHWHIDYIYMDRNRSRSDSIMEDNAFQYMSTSFLKNYSTMPYRQYRPSEMAPSVKNYMRNNFTGTKNTSYDYTVFDVNQVPVNFYNGGSANILPYRTNGLHNAPQHASAPVPFAFPASMPGMGIYTIRHVISSSPDVQRVNDTIWQTQRFSDYYAYDDGTAESAYYLNTYGGICAVRYTINVPDTLRALRIYFDPTENGPNILNSTFNLMVWNDGANGPGSLIYSDSTNHESKPLYLQGKYNLMPVYILSQCILLAPGTYYFGIKQKTNVPLNIGFDKNTDHSNALFYNVGNGWLQSTLKGSLMINPLMGCLLPVLPVGVKEETESGNMAVYPNPAQNTIRISTPGLTTETSTLSIVSSVGQTVYESAFNPSDEIDISSLPNGMYIILIRGSELRMTPKKLIISR